MSEKSATPILVAGAVGTVVLLGVAWMFTASASRQAVVDAELYAAEKAAAVETVATETEPKQVVEAETEKATEVAEAEPEAEEVTETAAAESEEPAVTETAEAETEAESPAVTETVEVVTDEPALTEEAQAEVDDLAKPVVVSAAETEETTEDAAVDTAAATATAAAAATTAVAAIEGDATAGKKVFRKCKACHKIGEGAKNAVGPYLTGVVGRVQGSAEAYGKYSDGFKAAMAEGKVWTPEELNAFLTKPKDYMPGTGMAFGGLRKEKDRANIIAYLAGE